MNVTYLKEKNSIKMYNFDLVKNIIIKKMIILKRGFISYI